MRLTMVALAVNALWPRPAWMREAVWWEARRLTARDRFIERMRQVVRRGRV